MHRREILRTFLRGRSTVSVLPGRSVPKEPLQDEIITGSSRKWQASGDLLMGEGLLFANTQDWCVTNGELQCLVPGQNKKIMLTACKITGEERIFKATIVLRFGQQPASPVREFAGFTLGLQGDGDLLDAADHPIAGVTRCGSLFIGNTTGNRKIASRILTEGIRLFLDLILQSSGVYFARLHALDNAGNTVATVRSTEYSANDWHGRVGVVSHSCDCEANHEEPFIVISRVAIEAESFDTCSKPKGAPAQGAII